MSDCMTFPDTVEEFMEQYKMVDTEHIYSNGIEFVPIFRMQQWFEHLPSAEPEREVGKWILCDNQRQEDINNGNYMYICTNCLRSDVHAKTQKVPYCWWCGAKMEVEE